MASRLTEQERSLLGSIAALERWAKEDPVVGTAAARAAGPGSLDYWLTRVDPTGELEDGERRRRATAAKKAHFGRMALASARARRAKRGSTTDAA